MTMQAERINAAFEDRKCKRLYIETPSGKPQPLWAKPAQSHL